MIFKKLGARGFTLVEVIIVAGLMGGVALLMAELFKGQQKQTAKIELLYKTEQLRSVILGQVLDDPLNCKCMFESAPEFPSAVPAIAAPSPNEIGKYDFIVPGDCSGGIPKPIVNNSARGIDDVKLLSAEIVDAQFISGEYFGDLKILVSSAKEVTGVNQQQLKIPVKLITSNGSPGNQRFEGCSVSGAGVSGSFTNEIISQNGLIEFPNGLIMQWGVKVVPEGQSTVSFNQAFPSQVFSILVSGSNSKSSGKEDNMPDTYKHPALTTLSTFQVAGAAGGGVPISWFAIGR